MSLKYQSLDVQGQCILKQVRFLRLNWCKYIFFIILCIITLGIPFLLIFWYPSLKRFFQFDYVQQQHQGTHFWMINYDDQVTIQKKQTLAIYQTDQKIFNTVGFLNRYMKYYLDRNNIIRAIRFDVDQKIRQIVHQQKQNNYHGITFQTAAKLTQCYGVGAMVMEKPTLFKIFIHQVFRPMFLFILFSIFVWFLISYYYYVGVIILTTIVSLVINLYQTHKLNNQIYQMAYYQTKVNALRQGKIINISSLEVVPGDIVFLKNSDDRPNFKLPFDAKVLQGSVLINQCSLTGQSVPVVKKACSDLNNLQKDKNSIVYQGTTLIQVNAHLQFKYFQAYRQTFGVPVCVYKTNFYTSKGSLIRIIKFPKQQQNIFQKQSSKFLIFVFLMTLITYGLTAKYISDVITPRQVFRKILQLITISVPPSLPISMTIGIIYAVQKLQNKQIFCTSQNNIVKGGRVQHICFDKTGTLTQNYMDFYGLIPYFNGQFQKPIRNSDKKSKDNIISRNRAIANLKRILFNFGSNHSLIQNMKNKQIIGDPMQVKVFEYGEFKFDYSKNSDPNILFSFSNNHQIQGDVYKVFEFDSDVQRMSVICRTNQDEVYLFSKGSPEVMKTLFEAGSVSSKTYDKMLRLYSSKGFRILALGSRRLSEVNKSREELQRGLKFEGFSIFENCLKPQSHEAILQLKQADINCSMITGDNPLTACCIGLQCEIANEKQKKILILDKTEQNLKYQEFNSNNKDIQVPLPKTQQQLQQKVLDVASQYPDYQICITGNLFAALFQTNDHMIYSDKLKDFFSRIVIFARAKPNQKAKIISIYQHLGKVMGMCGDGANDCGALKQAQIGLSLSQTQASISAPFTSKVFNIRPMVQLIKECRAALATNFSLFNIMCMYSFIQYSTAVIAQLYYCYPNDLKFVYWDVICNFILLMTYGRIQTADKLTKQKPSNSLFSISNIVQLIAMVAIQIAGQLVCLYLMMHPFAQKISFYQNGGEKFNKQYFAKNKEWYLDSSQINVLFLFINMLYIASFIGISIERPWRKRFYTSWPFLVTFLLVTAYNILIIVVPWFRLPFWKLDQLSNRDANLALLCLTGIFSFIMYGNQKIILEPFTNFLRNRTKFRKDYL